MVAIVALLAAAGMTVASGPRAAVTGAPAAGTGAPSAAVATWHTGWALVPARPRHLTVTLGRRGSRTVAAGTVRAPARRHTLHRCLFDVDTPGRHYLPCRAIRLLPWRKLAGGPQRAG